MLVFAETGLGACIRKINGTDLSKAERMILKEVGTFNGVQVIREATSEDISYVRAMGGYIPE